MAIYDKYDESESNNPIVCNAILKIHDGEILYYRNVSQDGFRLATPSEQQLLFDALAKEGRYWDAEALEVKDIPTEEMIKNIFRKLHGNNISVNEAYRQINNIIPING